MIRIDLHARTILDDQKVWRLFPGSSYKFLEPFQEQNIGYLDFPGLVLPIGDLTKANDLIPRIVGSEAVRDGLIQEIDPIDFKSARKTAYRGLLENALINFYQVAKKGDLVVMPSPLFEKTAWIGEFSDNRVFPAPYRRENKLKVPARNIRWLKTVREHTMSGPLSDSLRHQHPFNVLENSRYVEVLSLAYSSFIYKERYVSTIYNGDDFLDTDAAFLGSISKLASAACRAIDKNQKGLGADIFDVIFGANDLAYTCQQESDIHSEGFNRYIGGTITALVVVALVAAYMKLSNSSSKSQVRQEINNLEIINSSPNADPICTAKVSAAAKRVLKTMDIDKTMRMCDAARHAAGRAKLQPSSRATEH